MGDRRRKRLTGGRRLAVVSFDGDGWGAERPRTRADCVGKPRPCPWVACKYHLGLNVTEAGSIWTPTSKAWQCYSQDADGNRLPAGGPDRSEEIADALLEHFADKPCCALDVADQAAEGVVLVDIGKPEGVTRERVRQVELRALSTLAAAPGLRDFR